MRSSINPVGMCTEMRQRRTKMVPDDFKYKRIPIIGMNWDNKPSW